MNIRGLATACGLVILGATSLQAQAGGSDRAAEACIRSFVDTYLPKSSPLQVRTLSQGSGVLAVRAKKYTIDLSARLSRSGKQIVTARCVADSNGQVITLDGPAPEGRTGSDLTASL